MAVIVNKNGYLFTYRTESKSFRSYACEDFEAYSALVLRLTGREVSSYPLDRRGLPDIQNGTTADHLHIYKTEKG